MLRQWWFAVMITASFCNCLFGPRLVEGAMFIPPFRLSGMYYPVQCVLCAIKIAPFFLFVYLSMFNPPFQFHGIYYQPQCVRLCAMINHIYRCVCNSKFVFLFVCYMGPMFNPPFRFQGMSSTLSSAFALATIFAYLCVQLQ